MRLGLNFGLGFCLISIHSVFAFPSKEFRGIQHGHRHQQHHSCSPEELYHKPTEKCYPLNGQGPCGNKMAFVEDRRNQGHGHCQCVDRIGCQYWPFTYWELENRCYPLFHQGPCQENEWLVDHHHHSESQRHNRDENQIRGVCKPRTCSPDLQNPSRMIFNHKGKCYHANSKGFCKHSQEKMYFMQGSTQLRCSAQPDPMPNVDGCSNFAPLSSGPQFPTSSPYSPGPPPLSPPSFPIQTIPDINYGNSGNDAPKLTLIPSSPSIIPIASDTINVADQRLLATSSPQPPPVLSTSPRVLTGIGGKLNCPPNHKLAQNGQCTPYALFE